MKDLDQPRQYNQHTKDINKVISNTLSGQRIIIL